MKSKEEVQRKKGTYTQGYTMYSTSSSIIGFLEEVTEMMPSYVQDTQVYEKYANKLLQLCYYDVQHKLDEPAIIEFFERIDFLDSQTFEQIGVWELLRDVAMHMKGTIYLAHPYLETPKKVEFTDKEFKFTHGTIQYAEKDEIKRIDGMKELPNYEKVYRGL